mmetsp:Transcript_26231/g.67777  ORF Transcript_26231/g.67777 Transcript_26231/m.67777 type:complete len:445 (+) Transcript_26231:12-1346(+)
MGGLLSTALAGGGSLAGCFAMRSVLALVGTTLGSCFGTCCASCACSACTMACKGSAQGARVAYLLLLAAGVVLALVLRFAFAPAMASWEGVQLVDMCEGSIECTGNEAVYRVAGTLAAFYLGLGALCACPGDVGASAHRGFWAIKLFVLSTAMVGSLWVPNGAFDAFASVSRVASVLFVLYQGLLLIDFAYMWNGKWVGLDEEADGFSWRAGILAICVALYAASFTGIGMMYSLYTGDECGFSSAVLTATLLAIVLFTGLGVSPLSPHGALLPSAIIAADCVYLAYSALSSNPVAACNPFSAPGDADGTGGHETLHLVVGLAMAGVSIAWKANSAATSVHLLHAPEAPVRALAPGAERARARRPTLRTPRGCGCMCSRSVHPHTVAIRSCVRDGRTLVRAGGHTAADHGERRGGADKRTRRRERRGERSRCSRRQRREGGAARG